jgi:hypothetical protein
MGLLKYKIYNSENKKSPSESAEHRSTGVRQRADKRMMSKNFRTGFPAMPRVDLEQCVTEGAIVGSTPEEVLSDLDERIGKRKLRSDLLSV